MKSDRKRPDLQVGLTLLGNFCCSSSQIQIQSLSIKIDAIENKLNQMIDIQLNNTKLMEKMIDIQLNNAKSMEKILMKLNEIDDKLNQEKKETVV